MDLAVFCGGNDANPTSVLEAACWGMVVLAPPTCGWGADLVAPLPLGDVDAAARAVDEWLEAPTARLEARRADVDLAIPRYSWEAFLLKVLEAVS